MPPIKFPPDLPETKRRYHVAAAVPPPFAMLVSMEACKYQQMSQQEKQAKAQVMRISTMSEQAAVEKAVELGVAPAGLHPEPPANFEFELDRGEHGVWEHWGEELGFKHKQVPIRDHMWQLAARPWMKRASAPRAEATRAEVHAARLKELHAQQSQWEEREAMNALSLRRQRGEV